MIVESELIMVGISAVALVFILANRDSLRKIPHEKPFIGSFLVLFLGWLCTVAEGFFFPVYLNILEHICYTVSALLLLWWCDRLSLLGQEE
ncbi:MAG: hypothetical protein GF333_00785 [Candidatus Omnitrophica bacterium]|nr:hypothetical protein [Candidatus Omnitrophota bacterium]